MTRMSRMAVLTIVATFVMTAGAALAGPLPKPSSKNPEAQKLIEQAWKLDHTDSSAEIYKQGYELMEQADKLDPNNNTILVEISRYYWNYGDQLPKETKEQQKINVDLYAKGAVAAEKALKIKETADAHYWLAVNKAAGLEFSSILTQVAAFPSLYDHTDKTKKMDRDYYYGASARLWSEVLARVPKAAVEAVCKVHDYIQEELDDMDHAIKTEPRFLDNYLYKARFVYIYYGDKERALTLLDQELKLDPNALPDEVTANKVSQRQSKELWKKITGKEYPQK
jgi:tetratricopeptide (TPR) repeat protein